MLLYDEGRYFLILSVWCHKCFLYLDWILLSSSWEIFHYDYFFSITTIFKMLSLALDWTLSYQLSVYLVFSKCPTYLDASWYLISLSLSLLDCSSSFTFSPGCVSLIFFDPFCKWDFIQFFYLKCYTLHFQGFRSFSSVFLLVEFMLHIFLLLYFIHL